MKENYDILYDGELNPFEFVTKRKIMIDKYTIDKISCMKIIEFNTNEINRIANAYIQKLHKLLLEYSMFCNKSNEVAFLIDLTNFNYIRMMGTQSEVLIGKYKTASDWINKSKKNTLLLMHNHPNCCSFSKLDLRFFTLNDSIYVMTAIGNNGNIQMIRKENNFKKEEILFLIEYKTKSQNDVNYFLKNDTKFHMTYRFGRCKHG